MTATPATTGTQATTNTKAATAAHGTPVAHVITGSFGAGKTTAIRWLMSTKPPDQLWVVILNEFTDMGLDALSVAQVASGRYDVRLVAGGCLCCVGELEFGKQLRDILRSLAPARLLIEPSGAGHAADIVDELAGYEAQGALTLDSVVCLVDPRDAHRIRVSREPAEWSQIQSADVLLMSKSDLADAAQRAAFDEIVAEQYPVKSFSGSCRGGELPPAALGRHARPPRFSLVSAEGARALGVAVPPLAAPQVAAPQVAAPGAAELPASREFVAAGRTGSETQVQQLGLWAVSWLLPRELTFSRVILEPRLTWLLQAYGGWLRRFKGVFRTGPGPSWLVQSHGRGLSGEDSGYRRDSRIEIVMNAAPTPAFLDAWRDTLRAAAEAAQRRAT